MPGYQNLLLYLETNRYSCASRLKIIIESRGGARLGKRVGARGKNGRLDGAALAT